MSIDSLRSNVSRIQKDLSDLRLKDASEAKKEADLNGKIAKASSDARSSRTASTIQSRLRDVERYSKEVASLQGKRADFAKNMASKNTDLIRYQNDLIKEEDRQRKRLNEEQKRSSDQQDRRMKELQMRLSNSMAVARTISIPLSNQAEADEVEVDYDVFVSHASEDKFSFADELAQKLKDAGVLVWYDDMVLGWGGSLRRSIDKGLSKSRFGVVILSTNFFKKEWPQRELDGLVQLETVGQARILPIWHNISHDEVARASPTLADKVALKTAVMSVDEIVTELKTLAGK